MTCIHHHHHHCCCEDDGGVRMSHGVGSGDRFNNANTVRIYTKANENYSLSLRDGHVVLAPTDIYDDRQHWVKVNKYSNSVRDATGRPCFALINKATDFAIKHSFGSKQPVQVTGYDYNNFDETVLWAQSEDLGGGFHCIRMINNIRLNFDAFNGNPRNGGSIYDGTPVMLWEWLHGDNQLWKMIPFY